MIKIFKSCIVLLTIFLTLLSTSLSSDEFAISCQPQGNFKVRSKSGKIFNIYDVNIKTNLYNAESECTYTNPRITGENVVPSHLHQQFERYTTNLIEFTGFVRPEDEVAKQKKHIEHHNNLTITVQYHKDIDYKGDIDYVWKKHCSIGFLENFVSSSLDEIVESLILHLIESCIQTHLCQKIDPMEWRPYDIQSSINDIGDSIGQLIISTFILPNTQIPDIETSYEHTFANFGFTSLKTTALIHGRNASIVTPPSIKRSGDVRIGHDNYRFMLSIDFSLYDIVLNFKNISVKVSFVTSSGEATAYVERVSFSATVAFDYNVEPCRASLDDFDIYDFGDIIIDNTKMSLYQLNNQSSSIVNRVVLSAANNVTTKILQDHLASLNCDEFSYSRDNRSFFQLFWDTLYPNDA